MLGTFPAPPSTAQPSNRDSAGPSFTQIDSFSEPTDVIRLPAILRIERTAFSPTFTDHLSTGIVTSTKCIGDTDIVRTRHAHTKLSIGMFCAVFVAAWVVGSQGRHTRRKDHGDIPCDRSAYSKGTCVTFFLHAMLIDCTAPVHETRTHHGHRNT